MLAIKLPFRKRPLIGKGSYWIGGKGSPIVVIFALGEQLEQMSSLAATAP